MATIRLQPEGQEIDCGPEQSVLRALEQAGYPLPSDCRAGTCGTCKAKLAAGEIEMGTYLPMALPEGDKDAGYRLTCIGTPATDVVEIEYGEAQDRAGELPVELFPPQENVDTILVDKIDRTPEILELRLRPVGDRLRYWPGQYVEIHAPTGETRPYSIANAPRPDGEMAFHVALTKGGAVSTWLHEQAGFGTRVRISGPYGTFVGDPDETGPVLCIAGGSGLAPIMALADAALRRGYDDPVTLLFSARTEADIYARGLLTYWQAQFPNFEFVTTLTQQDDDESAQLHGRIPQVIDEVTPDLSAHQVFIAGSPDFVEACTASAHDHDAREERIHAENYFPQARDDNPGG
jgi:CDP-4-dehydro-6-deoxyglucose reductase